MKLNNKGFAITGILYAVMVLFLTLVVSLLAMVSNRKLALDKYKKSVKNNLNEYEETYGARVQIAPDTIYVRVNENELINFDLKRDVSACLRGGSSVGDLNTLCQANEADITNLLNYKIYDETGNEVIGFYSNTLYNSDYQTETIYYKYYEKDINGNYLLDETKKNLKLINRNLTTDYENKFYVRYYVVDNNNVLSKEVTRTLIVIKYNNYIKVISNYFKINRSDIITYNFKENAIVYKNQNNSLIQDNTLLKYKIYNSSDENIIDFYEENNTLFYRTSTTIKEVTPDEKFRIRYFTGTIDNLTSEINFAYFTIE